MGKMNYVVEVAGKRELANVDLMLEKISNVCAKVERAQDSYKTIMEEVYLIHEFKPYKKEGERSFERYMKERTGMSSMTAKNLARIWAVKVEAVERLVKKDTLDTLEEIYKSSSMRTLITIARYKEQFLSSLELVENGECLPINVMDHFNMLVQLEEEKALIEANEKEDTVNAEDLAPDRKETESVSAEENETEWEYGEIIKDLKSGYQKEFLIDKESIENGMLYYLNRLMLKLTNAVENDAPIIVRFECKCE